jgi:hypothetical protein
MPARLYVSWKLNDSSPKRHLDYRFRTAPQKTVGAGTFITTTGAAKIAAKEFE